MSDRIAAPRPAFRVPLLVTGLVALLVFGADTAAATVQQHLAFDVPLERGVQAVPWGPVVPVFGWVDWFEGVRQVVATAVVMALVLVLNWRAVFLGVALAFSGAAYGLTAMLIQRPRPPASLVHVVRHTQGFSYPSGHEVFFCWLLTLLALLLVRPYLPRVAMASAVLVSLIVLALVGLGRVEVGEHWPSDVLGGLALGVGWTCLALSVRRLSDPLLTRVGPRVRGAAPTRAGRSRRGPARLWG